MQSLFAKIKPDDAPVTEKQSSAVDHREDDKEAGITVHNQHVENDSESLSADAQAGVKKIEATTSIWSTSHLIAAYIM